MNTNPPSKRKRLTTWKDQTVNNWNCNETQDWISSLNIISEDDKTKFISGIKQSNLTGTDFLMCQNGKEIADSFDGISPQIGNLIFNELNTLSSNSSLSTHPPNKKHRIDNKTFVNWNIIFNKNIWEISVYKGTPLIDIKQNISELIGIDEFISKDNEGSVLFLSSYLPNDTNIYIYDKIHKIFNFTIGDKVDCRDKYGKWYLSTIVQHKKYHLTQKLEEIYVHYIGWDNKYDEWIGIQNDILCECNGKCEHLNHRIAKAKTQSVSEMPLMDKRNRIGNIIDKKMKTHTQEKHIDKIENVNNNNESDDRVIFLKVREIDVEDSEPMYVKVKSKTSWLKVFQRFSDYKGKELGTWRFLHNGFCLNSDLGHTVGNITGHMDEMELSELNNGDYIEIAAHGEMKGS
eukprot:516424_1